MKKLIQIALFSILLALVAVASIRLRAWMTQPPEVEVVAAAQQDVRRVLALTGRIRPEKRNQLLPAVRARLLQLTRDDGEAVREGDVLARLDSRQAEADLAQARLAMRRDETELEQLRLDLRRSEALASEELLPTRDLEAARFAVQRMERRVEESGELIGELEVRLDDYVLRSPLDGYVLERPVDPGQVVGPEDVIFELATAAEPEVEMEVDERYLGELALGLEAQVATLGGRDMRSAEVSYIGKQIDRLSGAVIVRLRFRGEAPNLPIGLSLDVNLEVAKHPQALTVPRSAVAGLGGQAWVLVIDNGFTRRRNLKVIDWPAPTLVVLDGLAVDEQIVLDPRQVDEDTEVRTRIEAGP